MLTAERSIPRPDEELAWGEDYRIVLRDMEDGELRERFDDQLSGGSGKDKPSKARKWLDKNRNVVQCSLPAA